MRVCILRWLPATFMMMAIFVFSSVPSKEMPGFGDLDAFVKKTGHMLGYVLLTASYWRGLQSRYRMAGGLSVFFAVFYAITDEFHQSFVPGRNASPLDVLIDAVGCVLCWYLINKYSTFRQILLWKVV